MASAATLSLWHKNWNHKERVSGLRSSGIGMSKVKDQDIFTFILMQEDRRGKVQFKTVFPVWGGVLNLSKMVKGSLYFTNKKKR